MSPQRRGTTLTPYQPLTVADARADLEAAEENLARLREEVVEGRRVPPTHFEKAQTAVHLAELALRGAQKRDKEQAAEDYNQRKAALYDAVTPALADAEDAVRAAPEAIVDAIGGLFEAVEGFDLAAADARSKFTQLAYQVPLEIRDEITSPPPHYDGFDAIALIFHAVLAAIDTHYGTDRPNAVRAADRALEAMAVRVRSGSYGRRIQP